MEGVARHIQDPVARLRFLKVAAPCVEAGATSSTRSGRRTLLMLVVCLAAIACVIIAFAAGYEKAGGFR
jgi:hypothetical protein